MAAKPKSKSGRISAPKDRKTGKFQAKPPVEKKPKALVGRPPKKERGLTDRARRFLAEYLQDFAPGAAWERAFGKHDHPFRKARQILKRSAVRAAIDLAIAKRAERIDVNAEWVALRLVENVERSMQARPKVGEDGRVAEWRWDGAVANKALELLGRHVGFFRDTVRHEHSGAPGGLPIPHAVLDITDLLKAMPSAVQEQAIRIIEERQALAAAKPKETSDGQGQ